MLNIIDISHQQRIPFLAKWASIVGVIYHFFIVLFWRCLKISMNNYFLTKIWNWWRTPLFSFIGLPVKERNVSIELKIRGIQDGLFVSITIWDTSLTLSKKDFNWQESSLLYQLNLRMRIHLLIWLDVDEYLNNWRESMFYLIHYYISAIYECVTPI